MSRLQRYIADVGGAALARQLGCSRQLISHWAVGRQLPSPKMALRIADLSAGALTASEIRPDIFRDPSTSESAA
jgi:DNA-binding transcriptional regulator YdaS (Cro superfamily)